MKFTLSSENEWNKTKEMNYYNVSLYLDVFSFVYTPQP